MQRSKAKIGIVSYGLYTPEAFETAGELASASGLTPEELKTLGIERKSKPSAEDHPVPMAVKAAKMAFERSGGVSPEQVDLVIWTGEEYKDYIAQTAAIRLQEETECRNAWAFDLVGQGVTAIQGLKVAGDMMTSDPRIKTVLLAGGTRNVDLVNPANPDTRFLLAASASGGAFLLQRDHPKNRLLGTAFSVDWDMADEVYVPGGGTEIPFAPDNLDSDIMYFNTPRPAVVADYLRKRWVPGLCGVARTVLAGKTPDYVALRHLAPADRSEVLKDLGVSDTQSPSLERWGSHGTNDPLLSLNLGLKSGAVMDGSLVVMVCGGIGFTYAAAAVQWGPCGQGEA